MGVVLRIGLAIVVGGMVGSGWGALFRPSVDDNGDRDFVSRLDEKIRLDLQPSRERRASLHMWRMWYRGLRSPARKEYAAAFGVNAWDAPKPCDGPGPPRPEPELLPPEAQKHRAEFLAGCAKRNERIEELELQHADWRAGRTIRADSASLYSP